MARKSTGKAQRFRIFARDGWRCRYCGNQPPKVVLVIDHVVPVAAGGTSDDTNLITSCEHCNQGKGSKVLETLAPTGDDAMRLAQEYAEQKALADASAHAAKSRAALQQTLVNYWCDAFGTKDMLKSDATRLVNLSAEFSPAIVMGWIDLTAAKGINDRRAMMYVNGIVRNVKRGPQ